MITSRYGMDAIDLYKIDLASVMAPRLVGRINMSGISPSHLLGSLSRVYV